MRNNPALRKMLPLVQRFFLICLCVVFVAVSDVLSANLHPLRPKQDQCFDTYQEHSTLHLQTLDKTCMSTLSKYKSCVGLQAQTDETVIVKCRTKMGKNQKLDDGCYRYIGKDSKEGVICQKFDKGRGCEVINLPSGRNIDVYCRPLMPQGGIIMLRPTTIAPSKV